MMEADFKIHGMTCAACAITVEKAIQSVPGVKSVEVNLLTHKARVLLEPGISGKVDLAALENAVRIAGYELLPGASFESQDQERRERFRVLGSAALTLPLMHVFSLPFWIQFGLAATVQLGFGLSFYRGAWAALRNRSGNMDLLIALGTTSAFALSFLGHHPYFESAASILTLVRLGKWLELRAKAKTLKSLEALESLQPSVARLQMGDQEFEMPISGIKRGDRVVVLPGERIPLDGEILEGETEIDESFLTGESVLVAKKAGDPVIGASINTIGRLVIQVTRLGADTLLSKVIRLIEDANAKKAPIQKLVDRVSSVFVPAVVIFAGLVLLAAFFSRGHLDEEAFTRAISVLVIACPCALGLATPTAMMVGTGLAAKHGILIRDPDALELAHRMTALALDKTGTLTEGKPRLVGIESTHPERALNLAAAIQKGSEHPFAKAILEAQTTPASVKATGFRVLPGAGIEARIVGSEQSVGMGNARFLSMHGITEPETSSSESRDPSESVSYLVELDSRRVEGVFRFKDEVKGGADEFIRRLKKEGIEPILLSGDRTPVVESIANRLGIETALGGLNPEEKSAVIRELQSKGKVIGMLGDGMNDGPALATADIGIALSSGTDVAMQSAGITLLGRDPSKALLAIQISRKTHSRIRQNLAWAFGYNAICIPLAAAGVLSPSIAGLAMALSSVSVALSSLALGRAKWTSS